MRPLPLLFWRSFGSYLFDAQGVFAGPLFLGVANLDYVQARVTQPLGCLDVFHVFRNPGIRLGATGNGEIVSGLSYAREIDSIRHGIGDLMEYVHDLRSAALEFLDHVHPRDQILFGRFEISNLADLPVESFDLVLKNAVSELLVRNPVLLVVVTGKPDTGPHQ